MMGFDSDAAASVASTCGSVGAATSGSVVAGAGAFGEVAQADINIISPISKKMAIFFMRFLLSNSFFSASFPADFCIN
jgi:hypothetical protein